MSLFDFIVESPPDAIFGLTATYQADPRPHKVNLMVGYYKTEGLKTPVLETVKKSEKYLAEKCGSKEYLSFTGERSFLECTGKLVFGDALWHDASHRMYAAQSIGGTGGLKVGGDFLKQEVSDLIHISEPTWPNHRGVFTRSGFKVGGYPYYDFERKSLDFEGMCRYCERLQPREIVVLHACCHNPTGADLSLEQWKILSDLFLRKKIIPFFDMAYQGFAEGTEEDSRSIRLFAKEGHEMLVATSYSKNFSLYGERIGTLFVIAESSKNLVRLGSKINSIIRTIYSNPPRHGAEIVQHILGDPSLKKEWESEVGSMRKRIIEMRRALVSALMKAQDASDFSFLNDRTGLFCFTGLSKPQVDRLIAEYAVYMTGDGRINVAGLNWENLDYVVNSICAVLSS